ncbi:nucleotidyl transferase AbiEii/AbiGii toxin family protein [Lactobacillus helveticus]|uniref:Abortive phage infection protein n=5 Tax=Lactobacillus helveticus TaxID=1587 RepID=A0A9Q5G888_LACHE|nr:nucleotidyl transferase AbiEii/AbiGii toxin family protein [Lactobacillus helveticus]ADX70266.1 Domain of hypothetical function DUF1814 [Lactobacillus helveticus H10]ALI52632.1 abortive phage infection protein [Lactobacillus helveticus]KXN77553.1 abortive phage infection protein [Lactobacillus helveticus]MCT3425440.1 nucleotidyl transferase AbiEii/AbiGii toxin family protein [Lactobacillus helveticus]NRN79280.1 hypothetical protein [Lactobacillus helveticus]
MKNYVDEKQFKADIRKYAQRNHISGNEIGRLWQEVMLDDLLKRISISKYKDNFILKGGLLLSAVVGINNRSTEDIDGEIKGFDLTEDEIEKVFTVICNTKPDNDPLEIILTKIEKIHENEEYKGFRLHFNASFKTIKYPLKVDISTGDVITPREIHYNYMPHLEDEKIEIWAYNMETVTADYRNSIFYKEGKIDKDYCLQQIDKIQNNQRMQRLWQNYVRKHPFVNGITFDQTILATRGWIEKIDNY